MRAKAVLAAAGLIFLAGCSRDAAQPASKDLTSGTDHPVANANPPPLAAVARRVVTEQPPSACPKGMQLVEGMYCPDVRQNCQRYMDPPGRYEYFRCAEYAKPAVCASKQRKHMRFCIDRDEFVKEGETLPANRQSYNDAERTCQGMGKRVCLESEYNFACEGEEMRPYPYGFKRDPTACNADHSDVVSPAGRLRDLRAPPGAYPRCESPFGVRDLAGNLEEFVSIDGTKPVRPAMKGAYWQPSRNFCRAAQTAHDRFYNGTETGFRCCSDG